MTETAIFRALGDPTRRAVFEALAGGERTVGDLANAFPISQPAVSQHLATLRGAGLVSERRVGRRAFYRVEPRGLSPLAGWLARYQAFWPERVEALRAVLKEME